MEQGTEKAKGPAPVMRASEQLEDGSWSDKLVLWKATGESRAAFSGFAVVDGARRDVLGFINTNGETQSKFVNLNAKKDDGTYERIGVGNAINTSKNGKQVYFDTVAFNFANQTIYGRLTKSATDELQRELGFTNPRVERIKPAAELPAEAPDEADHEPEAVAPQSSLDRFSAFSR